MVLLVKVIKKLINMFNYSDNTFEIVINYFTISLIRHDISLHVFSFVVINKLFVMRITSDPYGKN